MSAYILLITCRGPCRALRDQKNNNCCLIAALSPGGRVCRVSPWGRCVCIGSLSRPRGAKRRFILHSYWLDKQSLVLHQAPAAVYEPFIDDSGKFIQPDSIYCTSSLYRTNLRFCASECFWNFVSSSHGSCLLCFFYSVLIFFLYT